MRADGGGEGGPSKCVAMRLRVRSRLLHPSEEGEQDGELARLAMAALDADGRHFVVSRTPGLLEVVRRDAEAEAAHEEATRKEAVLAFEAFAAPANGVAAGGGAAGAAAGVAQDAAEVAAEVAAAAAAAGIEGALPMPPPQQPQPTSAGPLPEATDLLRLRTTFDARVLVRGDLGMAAPSSACDGCAMVAFAVGTDGEVARIAVSSVEKGAESCIEGNA